MTIKCSGSLGSSLVFSILLAACAESGVESGPTSPTLARSETIQAQTSVAGLYVADFVATAATGYAMNDAGDVVGTSYTDPGCGLFCLPPQEIVAWRGGNRIVLPGIPAFGRTSIRSPSTTRR